MPGVLAYYTYVAEVIAPARLILGYRLRNAMTIAFDTVAAISLVLRSQNSLC